MRRVNSARSLYCGMNEALTCPFPTREYQAAKYALHSHYKESLAQLLFPNPKRASTGHFVCNACCVA